MRMLKALVAIMGIMIVAGLGVIAVTLVRRLSAGRPAEPVVERPSFGGAAISAVLRLPPGGHIEAMTGVGARLVLRVTAPGRSDTLLVVDPETGRLLGTIETRD